MSENIYRLIGKNIKNYRLKNNISGANLAELSGYSYEFIRRIESPNSKFGFSKALKINISCLFEGVKTYE